MQSNRPHSLEDNLHQIHSQTGLPQDYRNIWAGLETEVSLYWGSSIDIAFFDANISPLPTVEEYLAQSWNREQLEKTPLPHEAVMYINRSVARINIFLDGLKKLGQTKDENADGIYFETLMQGIRTECKLLNKYLGGLDSIKNTTVTTVASTLVH
jgi:hypothetical protein